MLRIEDPVGFRKLLCPDFVCVGSHYCVQFDPAEMAQDLPHASAYELESHEWTQNHYHLFDFIGHDIPLVGQDPDEMLQDDHEDFVQAWMIAKRMADVWAMKLRVCFPGVDFAVVVTRMSGPIIRFYNLRGSVFLGPLPEYFAQNLADDTGYYVLTSKPA
jgi:hypothetical protein